MLLPGGRVEMLRSAQHDRNLAFPNFETAGKKPAMGNVLNRFVLQELDSPEPPITRRRLPGFTYRNSPMMALITTIVTTV